MHVPGAPRNALARAAAVLIAVLAVGGTRARAQEPSPATPTTVVATATAVLVRARTVERRNLVARGGGSLATEAAVEAGLRWLARHQGPDGGWHGAKFSQSCPTGTACSGRGYDLFDVGLTGLALLAFLGAGHTPLDGETYEDPRTHETMRFGSCVERGLAYLRSLQDGVGCFGTRTGEFMYNHSLATSAVLEAYALTGASECRTAAERAVSFIIVAQNPYRAWRYSVKPGDNDTSVTGWCVAALETAGLAGLARPTKAEYTWHSGALAWLDWVTDGDGMVGYNDPGRVDVIVKGKNEAWGPHPSMTAIGLLCRLELEKETGAKSNPEQLAKHAALILKDLPRWKEPTGNKPIDFYYWYYGSLALFQYDGPDGRCWRTWNGSMKAALVQHQKVQKDGCEDGSWDPSCDRWGFVGGRVYATAMNVLTLETYYRFPIAERAR